MIPTAIPFDNALRWHVPSRTDPHVVHLVELDDYFGNGRCDCQDFCFRLEPLLRRLVTPEQAVAQKLVRLKHGQREQDALRCWHAIEARSAFADLMIKSISNAAQTHTPEKDRQASAA